MSCLIGLDAMATSIVSTPLEVSRTEQVTHNVAALGLTLLVEHAAADDAASGGGENLLYSLSRPHD